MYVVKLLAGIAAHARDNKQGRGTAFGCVSNSILEQANSICKLKAWCIMVPEPGWAPFYHYIF